MLKEHVGRGEECEGGVMMLLVVPLDLAVDPDSCLLQVMKTLGHIRPGLHRPKAGLGVRVIIRNLRPAEAGRDLVLNECILQQGRGHRGTTVRVDAQRARFDLIAVQRHGEELLGVDRVFVLRCHPTDHIPAEQVEPRSRGAPSLPGLHLLLGGLKGVNVSPSAFPLRLH